MDVYSYHDLEFWTHTHC